MSAGYRYDQNAHPLMMPGVLDGPQSSFETRSWLSRGVSIGERCPVLRTHRAP